jgi:two-component system, OmpR family, sensor kinase
MTFKKRVLLALLVLSLATLAVGATATAVTARYLFSRIDKTLLSGPLSASRVNTVRQFELPPDSCSLTQVVSDALIVIAGPDGTPRGLCPGQAQPRIDFSQLNLSVGETTTPFTVRDGNSKPYRVLVRRVPAGYFGVGLSLAPTERTIQRVALLQLGATLFSVGGSALVAFWLLRRGVKPLTRIAATADSIAGGDRSQRLDLTGHHSDEIGKLGRALNSMLDELDHSITTVEQSEQRLRTFVQDASHELRTPLTSIRGYAELHHSGALDHPDAVTDAMNRIQHEALRMTDLVNDMLQLANFDTETELQLAPTNVISLLETAIADAQAADSRWSIELIAPRSRVEIELDSNAILQVAANLFANIRSHTAPGTRAEMRVSTTGQHVVIELRDFGPGIDPAVTTELFERFVQANPSRHRNGSGAGLGLSIVRSIISAHHGTIDASNHPDGGAVFTVSLPRARRLGDKA